MDTDASNFGIGAVLSQIQDGDEKVIAYAAKSLSKTQKRYCTTKRELLAVVHFVATTFQSLPNWRGVHSIALITAASPG